MKSARGIKATRRALKELREVVEHSPDPCERRIAYAMEMALRWATEEGIRGWPTMAREAKLSAAVLRHELEASERRLLRTTR